MGTNWAAFAARPDRRRRLRHAAGSRREHGRCRAGDRGPAAAADMRQTRAVYVPEAIAWHYLHREFLDPAWVLRRPYRHGLEWGIRRTRGRERSWSPFLRAALGRLNAHVKGHVLRLLGGEARRFEAAYHEAKWRGRWDGLWLGRAVGPVAATRAHDAAASECGGACLSTVPGRGCWDSALTRQDGAASSSPHYLRTYRFENCTPRRAPRRPYFLRSFMRESRVRIAAAAERGEGLACRCATGPGRCPSCRRRPGRWGRRRCR